MTDERDEILDVWQAQSADDFRMSPDALRTQLASLERRVRVRTRGGLLVTVSLIVCFFWMLTISRHVMMTTGIALVLIGVAYLGYQVWQNRSRSGAPFVGGVPSIDYLRSELARQRDFHRGKTFWTRMAIFTPGPLVLFPGFALAYPKVAWMIWIEAAMAVAGLVAAVPLNYSLARKYQRQIDELDRLQEIS